MLIISLGFLVFFSLVLLVYWKLAPRYQWWLLLAASAYFYLSWKPVYGLLLAATILISFFAARQMAAHRAQKRWWLGACLVAIFGVLFSFKYFNLFSLTATQILAWLGVSVMLPQFQLLLPLGLSFYTFQTAGYLIDVYRGTIKPEKNLGVFALFVSFFPLVSAGPIERAPHLLPQLHKPHRFEYQRTVSGLQLLTLGLFKKIVLADNLGLVVDQVFGALPEYKGLSLVLAVVIFSWQIYCDFSGYTDMARGLARILGYDILENFRTPYLATSIRDFWQRWHITLSSWFKDYLYIPLGGSRQGLWRTCANTIIVFTLCGLWHGASWNFVLWGLFHGLLLSGQRVLTHYLGHTIRVPAMISVGVTYGLVCVSWIFFRASTLQDSLYILRNSVVGIKNFILPSYIVSTLSQMFKTNRLEIGITFLCLLTVVCLDLLASRKAANQLLARQPLALRWVIYSVAILLIVMLRNAEVTRFIYVQF